MPHTREALEQRLVRALAHPLRVQILDVLSERVASPNWLSERLEIDLGHVAYHTRALDRCGCLQLVDTAQKRGATEHFYKASPISFVGDRGWRKVPRAIRGGFSAAWLQTFVDKFVAALEAGTIDSCEGTVLNWTPLLLDSRGCKEVKGILEEATDRVLAAQARSGKRLSGGKRKRGAISAVAALASFETAGSRQP
jgi:DNA-binding transcriptional ArsR family regulator